MNISIKKLLFNDGQIKGLPRNPRFIRDSRFNKLKKSIQDDPEMLELRELIVFPLGNKFVAIGGNMRLRAASELGLSEMPCKVLPEDTPVEKLRAYTIKDNISFGEDDDDLMTEWDEIELEDFGFDFGVETDFEEPKKSKELGGQEALGEEPEIDTSNFNQTANSYLNSTIRQIVLYYDVETHKEVLDALEKIGVQYGIVDDNSSVVSKLIEFHNVSA